MKSRQYLAQLRNKSLGMCGNHKNNPIFKAGLCEHCYTLRLIVTRKTRGIKEENYHVNKRAKFAAIDLTRPVAELEEELNVTRNQVYHYRKRFGIPSNDKRGPKPKK